MIWVYSYSDSVGIPINSTDSTKNSQLSLDTVEQQIDVLEQEFQSVYNGFGDELFDYEDNLRQLERLRKIKKNLQEIERLQKEINSL